MVSFRNGELRERIESVNDLATLPETLTRILDVVLDESSNATDLGDEISQDPVLAAKVLRIVNSAFYGFYRKITAISDAVVLMGYNEIRTVVMAVSAMDLFHASGPHGHFRRRLWEHTVSTAATTDILAQCSHREVHAAFTAGLLHDIGKVVLDQVFPDEYSAALDRAENDSLRLREAEIGIFGTSHAEVGSWLAERWGLPPTIVEAIRYHHEPGLAREAYHLTSLVHVANALSHRWESEVKGDSSNQSVSAKACQEIELTRERALDAKEKFGQRMEALQPVLAS